MGRVSHARGFSAGGSRPHLPACPRGTTTGGSGGGASAIPGVGTAFVSVLGGAGDEWVQDVVAAPGGAVNGSALVQLDPSPGDPRWVARLSGIAPDGSTAWTRTVAAQISGVARTATGAVVVAVVVAGARSGTVDLGTGPLSSKGTDAILAGFGP